MFIGVAFAALAACGGGGGGGGGGTPLALQGSFDNGDQDAWGVSGLWHVSTANSSNGSSSMWYGQDATGDYDTGVANTGVLTSPLINLGMAPSISFDHFLDNECTAMGEGTLCTNDNLIAQISTNGGGTWTNLGTLGVSSTGFTSTTLSLVAYASMSANIRFLFDSVDAANNAFEGAYIDNVAFTDADYAPGISVTSPSFNNSTSEAAPIAVMASIVLDSQPSANVSIDFASDTPTEGDIQGSATVTFTRANWSTPQMISIVGVDDVSVDGDQGYTVASAPAVSTDVLYNTLDPADINMTNVDDGELAGVACAGTVALDDDPSPTSDDNYELVGLGFDFPFMGYNWDSVFVSSNGYLTFGVGEDDFSDSVAKMISFWPRIAGLYDDLNPANGGTVTCSGNATSMTISYNAVPEYSNTGANTFAITMNADGSIVVVYGAISAADGIAGISAGIAVQGLTDPGPVDLSANPIQTISNLVYEQNPNDLSGVTVTYSP